MKEGSLFHRISLALVPRLASWLIRAWFTTCRITEHDVHFRQQCREHDNPLIATFWHYAILYNFYHMRNESGVAMVSASKDGEYIARLARLFNFAPVRGSSHKKGMRALIEMMRLVTAGRHAAIVADGSQGPPMVVQAGSILLASKTGAPILPMLWSASRYYAVGSWDRMAIPKPFSRIDFYYGEPLFVPEGLDAEGIERYRVQLEENLHAVYKKAWALYGRTAH
ncbi:MAG: lysophospholipid acyltransferase family protein [Desulfocapsaceae bacterium]|nr:lysophospholipid acyltransferase family protein [Desulfocapsaceae bacterium]